MVRKMGCSSHYYWIAIELYEFKPKVNFSELYNELKNEEDYDWLILRERFGVPENNEEIDVYDFAKAFYNAANEDYLSHLIFTSKRIRIPASECGCGLDDGFEIWCSTGWLDKFEDINPENSECIEEVVRYANKLVRKNYGCYLVDVSIGHEYDCGVRSVDGNEIIICNERLKEDAERIYQLLRSRYGY